MSLRHIEGIKYEYFIVCRVNCKYKFLSIANKDNTTYTPGQYFFGNNYNEVLVFNTSEEANNFRITNDGVLQYTRIILEKEGFGVGAFEIVSVPRKELFELENYYI